MPFPWLIGAVVVGGLAYAAKKIAEDDDDYSGPSYSEQEEEAERKARKEQAERERKQKIISLKKDLYNFRLESDEVFQTKLQPLFRKAEGKFRVLCEDEVDDDVLPNLNRTFALSSVSKETIDRIYPYDKKMANSLKKVSMRFDYELKLNKKGKTLIGNLERYDELLELISKYKTDLIGLQETYLR